MATEIPNPDEAQSAIDNILTGNGEAPAVPSTQATPEQSPVEPAAVESMPSQEATLSPSPELGTNFTEGSAANEMSSALSTVQHGPETTEEVTFTEPAPAADNSSPEASAPAETTPDQSSAKTTQAPQTTEVPPNAA